ncbi:hypothetical protein WA556_007104 [Blastocystis sp. ATCC 50177/Nand II]
MGSCASSPLKEVVDSTPTEEKCSPSPRQVSPGASSIQAQGMNLHSEPSIPHAEERDSTVSPGVRKYSSQQLGAALSILSDINDNQFGDLSDSASYMSPDVDLDTLAREEVIDFICDSTMRPDAPPSFNSEKRAFIENVILSYQNHLDDVCHILEILGLDSVLYEPVVRKYVREDEWSELLIRMFEACKTESDERKLILQFIESCLSFIDKCVYYGIFDSLKIGTTQHSTKNVNIIVLCSLECRTIKLILVAVAGFKKRFPNMDLSSLQSGEMALLFPEPVRDFHDLTAQEREEAVLHWRQVEMVSRAIYRLAGEEDVHAIDDPAMAEKEVMEYQPPAMTFTETLGITAYAKKKQEDMRNQEVWNETLEVMQREQAWFKAVQSGTEADVETMTNLIYDDPNRFYQDWDPRKLINCVDNHGRTALYLACVDCNLRVVKFLIERNADPRIGCVVDEKSVETPLGCAVRWGYVELVKVLLENEGYCRAEIKTIAKLRKRCKNKEIEAMLKEKYAKYREE